jgi:hypothetical protein
VLQQVHVTAAVGDRLAEFKVKVKRAVGVARFSVVAKGGAETTYPDYRKKMQPSRLPLGGRSNN